VLGWKVPGLGGQKEALCQFRTPVEDLDLDSEQKRKRKNDLSKPMLNSFFFFPPTFWPIPRLERTREMVFFLLRRSRIFCLNHVYTRFDIAES
jgi:hypothetical protein